MGFLLFLKISNHGYQKIRGFGAESENIVVFVILIAKYVYFIDFAIPSAKSVPRINQIVK